MPQPATPPASGNDPAVRTYLAEERTFGAWLRTALTMLITALAVARFIYEREPSGEALAISLLMLAGAAAIVVRAEARFSAACARAASRGVRVPPRSLLLFLFLVLFASIVLAFALVVQG